MTPSLGPTDSAQVRGQLVTSLELELIGPTQRVLKALAAAGRTGDVRLLQQREGNLFELLSLLVVLILLGRLVVLEPLEGVVDGLLERRVVGFAERLLQTGERVFE